MLNFTVVLSQPIRSRNHPDTAIAQFHDLWLTIVQKCFYIFTVNIIILSCIFSVRVFRHKHHAELSALIVSVGIAHHIRIFAAQRSHHIGRPCSCNRSLRNIQVRGTTVFFLKNKTSAKTRCNTVLVNIAFHIINHRHKGIIIFHTAGSVFIVFFKFQVILFFHRDLKQGQPVMLAGSAAFDSHGRDLLDLVNNVAAHQVTVKLCVHNRIVVPTRELCRLVCNSACDKQPVKNAAANRYVLNNIDRHAGVIQAMLITCNTFAHKKHVITPPLLLSHSPRYLPPA